MRDYQSGLKKRERENLTVFFLPNTDLKYKHSNRFRVKKKKQGANLKVKGE